MNPYLKPKGNRAPRFFVWLTSIVFVGVIYFAHAHYLFPVQEFWGFPFYPMEFYECFFLVAAITAVVAVLPLYVNRPSALVVTVLYVLVYLPSLTITLATKPDAIDSYGYELVALMSGFVFVNLATRLLARKAGLSQPISMSSKAQLFLFAGCGVLFFFLMVAFYDVINFVGLDFIYDQRAAGRSRNAFEAYAQTYLAYVFAPAVFAIGLLKKNYLFLGFGLAGFTLMFGITAERTIFMLPLVMAAIYFAVRSRLSVPGLVGQILIVLSLTTSLIVLYHEENLVMSLLALYFVFRVIAIPGGMFWQYSDVFSNLGYTHWTHVTGVNFIVDVPAIFLRYKEWPQLGYVVAGEIIEMESNSNANLFAYDGIAAGGAIGIIAACVVLTVFLVILDRVTKNANAMFAMLVTFPMAFSLTNGSIFSLLLSFGGFFWIVFFAIASKRLKTSAQYRRFANK